MCDTDSNVRRVCSVGAGVHLCDFITLHANFNRGRRQSEDGRQRERERKQRGNGHVQEMDRLRKGEEKNGVMTALQALCLYICRQINHKITSYSIKMVI